MDEDEVMNDASGATPTQDAADAAGSGNVSANVVSASMGSNGDNNSEAETKDTTKTKDDPSPPTLKFDPDQIFHNDEGAPVTASNRVPYYLYCNRSLGADTIPGSDGTCGPDDGPQCPSCARFQYGPQRIQLLQRWFPNVEEDALCMALRKRGGVIGNAARFLKKLGAKEIKPNHLALPPVPDDEAVEEEEEEENNGGNEEENNNNGVNEDLVVQLVFSLGFPRDRAIAALRRHDGNIELAAAWVLEDPDAVDAAIREEEEKKEEKRREREEKIQARVDARNEVMESEVPEKVIQLGKECTNFASSSLEKKKRNSDDDEDVYLMQSHRMVLQKTNNEGEKVLLSHCNICASAVPSPAGGSYLCSLCGACEGCLSTTSSDLTLSSSSSSSACFKCPALANGGHLHQHPLVYGLDNQNRRCDVEGCGCLSKQNERNSDSSSEEEDDEDDEDFVKYRPSWTCRKCDFDACAVCMGKEAPSGYVRLLGRVAEKTAEAESTTAATEVTAGESMEVEEIEQASEEEEAGERVQDDDGEDPQPAVVEDDAANTGGDGNADAPQPQEENANEGNGEEEENNDDDNSSSDEEEEDEDDDDSDSYDSDSSSVPIGSRPYDAVAGERGAALRWEGSYEDRHASGEHDENGTEGRTVVVGTGEIGPRSVLTSTLDRQRRGRLIHGGTRDVDPTAVGVRTLLEERGFSEDEAQALELYRARRYRMSASASGMRQTSSSSSLAADEANAATDLAHVEDILHKAQGIDDRLTRRALCEAIAAGQLEIAGTLLMSQAFAPLSPRGQGETSATNNNDEDSADGNNNEEKEEEERKESDETKEVRCWCGDVIDSNTAPTGAVGCLGGHAMHASCAADLLLGGGSCPTCRQPLFFPRVAQTEAKSAAESTRQEMLLSRKEEEDRIRKEREELETQGLKLQPQNGDFVRISPDKKLCEEAQSSDPRSGGWGADMSASCGMEGRVTELIKDDKGETVALRVRTGSRGLGCELVRIRRKENYKCEECDMFGPTYQTGKRKCKYCQRCQTCVEARQDEDGNSNSFNRTGGTTSADCGACPVKGSKEWVWNPSVLEVIGHASAASLWDSSLVDREEAAAKAAERHLFRLRAELRAVMAAREAVRAEMGSSIEKEKQLSDMMEMQSCAVKDSDDITSLPKPLAMRGRELSTNSKAAVRHIMSTVSPADWKRARHLLLLARQWGESPDAKARRAALYEKVKAGDLDSVAREVRRYNASRTAEAARWADASMDRAEYIVESHSRIDLRAGPHLSAPRTGYVLGPGQMFHSGEEILDRNGNLWLSIAIEEPLLDIESFVGSNVVYDASHAKTSSRVIGSSVMRGPDWEYDDQDGGEGKKGIIVKGKKTGEVVVQWNDSPEDEYRYRAGRNGKHDLVFAGAPPLPPQGWLQVRPGGSGSPPVVTRARSALRCFSCGDSLVPPLRGRERFLTVGDVNHVKKGDRLFVAATMEPVVVEKSEKGRILCSFTTSTSGVSSEASGKEDKMDIDDDGEVAALVNKKDAKRLRSSKACETFSFWYRSEDLVLPKGKKSELNNDDECVVVDGDVRTRRELVLLCGGDEACARNMWNKASNERKASAKTGGGAFVEDEMDDAMSFASCARGHLMHARCLQGALLAGRCCPAIGCTEPLWVPKVQHERDEDDDTCCGGGDTSDVAAEAEALRVANELAGHAALVAARREGTAPSAEEEEDVTMAGIRDPRMCPACCCGPLFNNDCSDMQTHHGECSATALRGSGVEGQCTPDGRFKASASDIAARMMRISATESVADVLPRCPTHKVLVMFNGCLNCGHLFTDTSWDDMPKWDSKAKDLLALDKKKRNAASLLAKQIRKEAAMLQFERDALLDRWENGLIVSGEEDSNGTDAKKRKGVLGDLPPPPPPIEKYRVFGCSTDCTTSHSGEGNCLVCGQDWGHHSGHTCRQGMRGSWPLR